MKDKIVIGYGRMNPVTAGHEKLYDKIMSYGDEYDKMIILTSTHDRKKNPLTIDQKLKYANIAFPNINIIVGHKNGLIETLQHLISRKHLIVVCGDDRIVEFNTRINLYNHSLYNFESIQVVSSGNREQFPISGTMMREFVKNDDLESFKRSCPSRFDEETKQMMFDDLKKVLA